VNAELSPAYAGLSSELLRAAGVANRARYQVLDFAREADRPEPADAVIMHRVICCYPLMEPLVRAAAGRARLFLAMSFPRDTSLLSEDRGFWHLIILGRN